jgi:predicted TIM-barrel fold metal-dependent hydrolase
MADPRNTLDGIACHMPDLSTRKPSIAVPAGSCDTHFHLFTKPFPDHARYTPPPVGLDEYRAMIGRLGIERAVIVHTVLSRDYRGAIEALRASNGQWRAIALPDLQMSERQLAELNDAGFRGVRFNPYYNAEAELRNMEEVVARIKPFGWHLQFHLDARDLVQFAPRFEKLGVEIVIDHLGHMPADAPITHPGFQIMLRMLREKRCWVKLSAPMRFGDACPPYPNVTPFAQAIIEAGPDRVVWGSDWPHVVFEGFMPNDADLLDLLAVWAPDAALRKRILVDNPAALYGFGTAK